MFKKQIYGSVAVALIFVTLVVAVAPVIAAGQTVNVFKVTFNEPITVYRGRGGVSFSKPQFSGMVGVSSVNVSSLGTPAGLRWDGSFVYAIKLPSGTTAPFANYQATVFFELTKGWEVRAWNNSQMAIYYSGVGGWKKLSTYAVGSRLAAASLGPGTYALGMSQPQVHPAP